MNYNDLMQKTGKRINPKIYYFNGDEKVILEHDNLILSKPSFQGKLMGTVMRSLEVETTKELPNVPIYFENTVKFGDNEAIKNIGPYYLKEKPTYNADSKTYSHILYDSFLNAMIDYKPINIDYPTSVINFFKQLCLECGYTTDIDELPNGKRIIQYDIYDGINFTYRDVFEDIGQATGTLFGVDGKKIIKISLGIDEIIVNDDLLKNQNIETKEHFGPINCVFLSRAGDSDKIYKRDENLTEWNEITISDNQLMNDNNRSDYLPELYEALYGIEFDVFDFELIGYGGFDILQKIKIETGNNVYNSYVFNDIEEYTQGYTESIYTELPEENNEDYKSSDTTDKRINQTYIIVDKQNQTIENVVNQVDDTTEKVTKLEIDVENIKQEISEKADITIDGSTRNAELKIEKIFEGEPLNIKVHPIGEHIDLTYPTYTIYPNNNAFTRIRSYLKIENLDGSYSFEYDMPELLYYDEDNYDEFEIDYATQRCFKTKRIGFDENNRMIILDSPQVIELEYPEINMTKGDYKISLLDGYTNAYIYGEFVSQNDYTNLFATRVELNTAITQTKNSITQSVNAQIKEANGEIEELKGEVSLKVDTKDLFTEFNVNANQVVITSDNFKLSKEGKITATAGDIGGFEMDSTSFSKDISGLYNYDNFDSNIVASIVMDSVYLDSNIEKILDSNNDNAVNSADYANIRNIISGKTKNIKTASGRFEINSNDPKYCVSVKDEYDNIVASMGLSGINSTYVSCNNFICGYPSESFSDANIVSINGNTGEVYCTKLTQISLRKNKKNIMQFTDALNVIKDIDIYKYNFNFEKDSNKKHIGFVIGNDYNYSKEITSQNSNGEDIGVDLYSMVSVCMQAIKEQQSIIEKLTKRIEVLESERNR